MCAIFQGEGVGGPAVEPDIEDVLDLLEPLGIMLAQEIGVGPIEPGVGTFTGDQVDDTTIDGLIVQRFVSLSTNMASGAPQAR